MYELLTALNRFADQRQLEAGKGTPDDLRAFQRGTLVLKEFSQILGVFLKPPAIQVGAQATLRIGGTATAVVVLGDESLKHGLAVLLAETGNTMDTSQLAWNELADQLRDIRTEAKKTKNFALADRIRMRLAELGITLKDNPKGGSDWSRAL
jgi:hypothetical protein